MSTFTINTIGWLLMTEDAKQSKKLSDKINSVDGDSPCCAKDLNLYFKLPSYLDLNAHKGAAKSFTDYMNSNSKPNESMVLAAYNISNAHNYLTSELFKDGAFNKDIFKHTVRAIQNGFNALQKVGQQQHHNYLGDMLDDAKEKHHEYMEKEHPDTFVKEPNEMKTFSSSDKNSLVSTDTGKKTAGVIGENEGTFKISKSFFNKKSGRYQTKKTYVKPHTEENQ